MPNIQHMKRNKDANGLITVLGEACDIVHWAFYNLVDAGGCKIGRVEGAEIVAEVR